MRRQLPQSSPAAFIFLCRAGGGLKPHENCPDCEHAQLQSPLLKASQLHVAQKYCCLLTEKYKTSELFPLALGQTGLCVRNSSALCLSKHNWTPVTGFLPNLRFPSEVLDAVDHLYCSWLLSISQDSKWETFTFPRAGVWDLPCCHSHSS